MTAPGTNEPTFAEKEPAVLTALLSTAASLLLELLVRFGVSVPDDVKQIIAVAIPFVALLVTALRVRGLVLSPANWQRLQDRLDATNRDLGQANDMINGHEDALQAVEATVVSALTKVVTHLESRPSAPAVAPVAPVPTPPQPQPTEWTGKASTTAVLPVVDGGEQIWASTPGAWSTYPTVPPTQR